MDKTVPTGAATLLHLSKKGTAILGLVSRPKIAGPSVALLNERAVHSLATSMG